MRGLLRNILRRLLGDGGYIVISPGRYEQWENMLAHITLLRGELADARERLLETKNGVSQLQQQSGESLSHVVVLRGEVADVRNLVAETTGGVSQLQSESGETLSHMIALRREIAVPGGTIAETSSGMPEEQSTAERAIGLRQRTNYFEKQGRIDRLRALPLQLDLAANGYANADTAAPHPSDESHALGEAHALAVHYARLANLVAQYWVAGAEPPADPYPDDDLSPEYASAVIGDRTNVSATGEPQLAPLPWRQLWADPDCGVFLVLGEGNAANHGEVRHTSLCDVFSLDFRTMRSGRAQDPLGSASAQGGSIWSRLGDKLVESGVFRRVLFVPLASEGSSIKDWTPEGRLHCRTALALSRLRKELGLSVLPFSAVLWQHGETEANRSLMSAQAYKMHFHDIVADLRANGVFAPVFAACATLGKSDGDAGQNRANIRRALIELADPEGGIFAGPDIDAIGVETRFDGGHLSEQGLARSAELWHDALAPRRRLIEKLVIGT